MNAEYFSTKSSPLLETQNKFSNNILSCSHAEFSNINTCETNAAYRSNFLQFNFCLITILIIYLMCSQNITGNNIPLIKGVFTGRHCIVRSLSVWSGRLSCLHKRISLHGVDTNKSRRIHVYCLKNAFVPKAYLIHT